MFNTNRNVTADNWFSSIEIVEELRKRGLTYVGTLKKNKREIPPQFLPDKIRAERSSLYGFTKECTMVSYVPKKNKAVVLVSSMHHTKSVDPDTAKPEIIAFYNSTKGGVDTLDMKCSTYSTNRRTRRWPLAIFYAVLNIASVNAFVLYGSYAQSPKTTRTTFIKNLARQLVEPHLNRRLANSKLPRELRMSIARILDKPIPTEENLQQNDGKRRRCQICPRSYDKKTKDICTTCSKPMCDTCRVHVCKDCQT